MSVVGIGVDLEPVTSFAKRKPPLREAFYRRVFSPAEIAYCRRFRDPAPHFAARFCAKEALVKAARPKTSLHVTDVEIANGPDGSPRMKARSKRAVVKRFFSRHTVEVSLSHSGEYAVAFVVLLRKRKTS